MTTKLTKRQEQKLAWLKEAGQARGLEITLSSDGEKIIYTDKKTGQFICTTLVRDL